MHDDDYIKEKKRRGFGVVMSLVALVAAMVLLYVSRSVVEAMELTVISLVLVCVSFVVLWVSMIRFCRI